MTAEGGPPRVVFEELEPLGNRAEMADLNESWKLELAPAGSGLGARLRYRLRLLVSRPVLLVLRPFAALVVSMQNRAVDRSDLLAERCDRLAEAVNDLAEALRLEAHRLTERDQLLHDLLEARIAALEAGEK